MDLLKMYFLLVIWGHINPLPCEGHPRSDQENKNQPCPTTEASTTSVYETTVKAAKAEITLDL